MVVARRLWTAAAGGSGGQAAVEAAGGSGGRVSDWAAAEAAGMGAAPMNAEQVQLSVRWASSIAVPLNVANVLFFFKATRGFFPALARGVSSARGHGGPSPPLIRDPDLDVAEVRRHLALDADDIADLGRVHRAQPPAVVPKDAHEPRLGAARHFRLQAREDSAQVLLLDTVPDGCARELLVLSSSATTSGWATASKKALASGSHRRHLLAHRAHRLACLPPRQPGSRWLGP